MPLLNELHELFGSLDSVLRECCASCDHNSSYYDALQRIGLDSAHVIYVVHQLCDEKNFTNLFPFFAAQTLR